MRGPAASAAAPSAPFELTGYVDPWSVRPGQRLRLMASSDADALEVAVVQLARAGEPDGSEPLVAALGRHPAARQQTRAGSWARGPQARALGPLAEGFTLALWAFPTVPGRSGPQALASLAGAFELTLEDGAPCARVGTAPPLRLPPLRERRWYLLALVHDGASGRTRLTVHPRDPDRAWPAPASVATDAPPARPAPTPDAHLLLAARPDGAGGAEACFDGKLEAPCLWSRPLADAELHALAASDAPAPAASPGLVLAWDLAREPSAARAWDAGPRGLHGTLVNMPTRAVTGRRWNGEQLDVRHAPEQYAAVHFHADDLEDAGWAPTLAWTVPDDLPSGVYAMRLSAGGRHDHVPFFVRPPAGRPGARAALLLPTFTYLAYANERLVWAGDPDEPHGRREDLVPDPADVYLRTRAELGLSCYDRHADGSGCCHSTRLRPIPNMRPGYRFWSSGGRERFGADLYLVEWLAHAGVAVDVLTDEDLHAEGAELLAPYAVVLTGTHPEYVSGAMLDALDAFTAAGGALMYLGGNGFYWVTSADPARPHAIEVRRGINGTRAWSSEPGECHHASTGEPGGLWRYRGRAPNRLCGVGFTAQSDALAPAAGYARLPASFEPDVAFAFEGVAAQDVFGDYGLTNGGAAGYEIDRFDPALGSPPDARVLASSRGRHNDTYLLAVEDMGVTDGSPGGASNPLVGADVVYFERPGGGRVFSVGSCNWCASLPHAGYDNDVARITGNVLRRFLAPPAADVDAR